MDAQRLRQLTTGILHTSVEDLQKDIAWLTGLGEPMVHQIPRALEVVKPKLLEQLQAFGEQRDFITEDLNRSVVGEVSIRPLTEEERDEVLEAFGKLPNPLARFL